MNVKRCYKYNVARNAEATPFDFSFRTVHASILRSRPFLLIKYINTCIYPEQKLCNIKKKYIAPTVDESHYLK